MHSEIISVKLPVIHQAVTAFLVDSWHLENHQHVQTISSPLASLKSKKGHYFENANLLRKATSRVWAGREWAGGMLGPCWVRPHLPDPLGKKGIGTQFTTVQFCCWKWGFLFKESANVYTSTSCTMLRTGVGSLYPKLHVHRLLETQAWPLSPQSRTKASPFASVWTHFRYEWVIKWSERM